MASSNEIVIKINGDIKSFEESLDKAKSETENLNDALKGMAAVSAVAFASLTAEIALSVKAFAESEQGANKLSQALKNQGIFSEELVEKYKAQADAVGQLIAVDDDIITQSQTILQGFLGEKQVTEELLVAVADLAEAKKLDLVTASNLVGKALDGNVEVLKRYGIELHDSADKNKILAEFIKQSNLAMGGQAEAAAQGLTGNFHRLTNAVDDLQKALGARFAPAINAVVVFMTDFINKIKDNKGLIQFIASVIAGGAALAGFVTFITATSAALTVMAAAAAAVGIAFGPAAIVVGALGLVVTAAAAALGNYAVKSAEAVDPTKKLEDQMKKTAETIERLKGQLTLAPQGSAEEDRIKKSLERNQKILDDAERELERRQARANINEAEQSEEAHKRRLQQKQRHQDELTKDTEFFYDDGFKLNAEFHQRTLEERQAQYEELLAQNEEFQALTVEQREAFRQENEIKAIESTQTESTARSQAAEERLKQQQAANAKFLQEQQKFGTAYAQINKVMNSEIYQGNKQAFGELAALQQSSNSTLKAIGKVAAIANIIIHGAESAMNVYAGFSTIPIIGQALGLAAAAAVVAFTAEQVGKVNAAADGGLLTGGIPGIDSIPVLAQHGELVAPTRNFDEVIGSVRAAREAEKLQDRYGGDEGEVAGAFGGRGGATSIMIGLDGKEASQVLTVRQIEDESLGLSQRSVV